MNTSSRMESTGRPGCVQISEAMYDMLGREDQVMFEPSGGIEVKVGEATAVCKYVVRTVVVANSGNSGKIVANSGHDCAHSADNSFPSLAHAAARALVHFQQHALTSHRKRDFACS